ncbi:ROK family protein [Cryptosporangium arvum]|uniref:ROK family protein n=1 Tax=Cryptosporangium arvum TaxID=80871 RepID=UPI0004B41D64|nr:ROK family protein [Cryptosporangium arvum]
MAETLATTGALRASDVTTAAHRGDPGARALPARAGRLVGATLATLVSFYDPGLVVVGGAVAHAGDYVPAAIRESVCRRSPAADPAA